MDFFDTRCYRINKFLLSAVGLWPFQMTASRRLGFVVGLYGVGNLCIPQVVYLCRILNDLDSVFECIPTIFGGAICAVKFVTFIYKAEEASWASLLDDDISRRIKSVLDICLASLVGVLLGRIQHDWKIIRINSELEILHKYAEFGRQLTVGYVMLVVGPLLLFALMPFSMPLLDIIAPLNVSRTKSLPYHVEFFIDQEKYFYTLLVNEYVALLISLSALVGVETTYIVFMEHVCGLFSIVRYRLENVLASTGASEKEKSILNTRKYDSVPIAEIVRLHLRAIQYAAMMETVFNGSFFFDFGLGLLLQSASLVMIIVRIDNKIDIVRYAGSAFGQTLRLFFSSWIGQMLVDHSTRVWIAAYNGRWYAASPREQRSLLFLTMRSQVPCNITITSIYVINLESFSAVLKTSVSYCTVMASLRETP